MKTYLKMEKTSDVSCYGQLKNPEKRPYDNTCENDRRCVWSLRCELLSSGGRRRRRLIRHLWTRAKISRVCAA